MATATPYDEMSVVVIDLWLSACPCRLADEVDYETMTVVDGPAETVSSRTPAPKVISVTHYVVTATTLKNVQS